MCRATLAGLTHVLHDCPGLSAHREQARGHARNGLVELDLYGEAKVDALKVKVRFVGVCMAKVVHGLRSRAHGEGVDEGWMGLPGP